MEMENTRNQWPGWETVRPIGHGSFGTVYEIERDLLGEKEKAALKVISIPQNDGDIEDLQNEGYDSDSITGTFQSYLKSIVSEYTMMKKLSDSPNVVRCDDVRYIQHEDKIGWDIYIKMELLTPLVKALSETIPEEQVLKIGMDMCRALVLCADYGIVHRDIKPQNIFVSAKGEYKLGDFGISKIVEKTTTQTMTGTPEFMAPEVHNFQPYGATADIYSLGMVLYWLLNERRGPFVPLPPAKLNPDTKEIARVRRFRGEAIPAPKHGSDALKQIVLKACAFDPKDRYRTAKEMLADLGKLHEGDFDAPEIWQEASPALPEERVVEPTVSVNPPPVREDQTWRVNPPPKSADNGSSDLTWRVNPPPKSADSGSSDLTWRVTPAPKAEPQEPAPNKKASKKLPILLVILAALLLAAVGGYGYLNCWFNHSWQEATCIAPETCSRCGETRGDVAAHIWDEGKETQAATHLEAGVKTYTCKTCNETKTEVIPAITEHVYNQQVTEDAYLLSKATCTTPAEYYYSCICGEKGTETFLYGTVNGHAYDEKWSTSETNHWHAAICEHTDQPSDFGEHTWDSGKATIEATCTSAGRMTYTCTACGRTRTEEVPALPHSFTQKNTNSKYLKQEATCTDPAEYYYSCTCGKMGTETFTDGAAKGHTFDEKWSASADSHWHAATCGHTDLTLDFGGHTWDSGKATTEATCTSTGKMLYTCTACGRTRTEEIPALPHSFTQKNTAKKYLKSEATCTDPAEYYYSCTCGKLGAEAFAYGEAKGHTFDKKWSVSEIDHWHAAICGHTDVTSDFGAHTWDNGTETQAPTHSASGVKAYTCAVCGKTRTEEIPAIPHSFTEQNTDWKYLKQGATCTTPAEYYYSCICGEQGTEVFINGSPKEHDWDSGIVVTAATAKTEGSRQYTCKDCGAVKTESIPKIAANVLRNMEFVDPMHATAPFWGQTSIPRSQVEKIVFSGSLDHVGENAWDVSKAQDQSILAWMEGGTLHVAADGVIALNPDSSYLFAGFSKMTSIDFGDCVDTSQVTDMCYMFYGCSNLKNLDLGNFNTAQVANMRYMFSSCKSLQSLDLSSFNTAQVVNMYSMFSDCLNLQSLNLSSFNTAQVVNMYSMFSECRKLQSLNLSSFNTAKVAKMGGMFSGCRNLQSLDLRCFDTAQVTDMLEMFYNCSSLQSLELDSFDTAQVVNMRNMFNGCRNLQSLNIGSFNTARVTNMRGMFNECRKLQSLNLRGFNTMQVTDMSYLFYDCCRLQSLDLSSFDTANVKNMEYMFYGCKNLQSLDLSGFNTAKVMNMQQMFFDCSSLRSLNLGNFDTAQVVNMQSMFSCCSGLQKLDLSSFDTANVKNMEYMFYGCKNLQSLDLSGFNTDRVTNMVYMFYDCTSLRKLDLSGFNTSQVKSIEQIFYGCRNLSNLKCTNSWIQQAYRSR